MGTSELIKAIKEAPSQFWDLFEGVEEQVLMDKEVQEAVFERMIDYWREGISDNEIIDVILGFSPFANSMPFVGMLVDMAMGTHSSQHYFDIMTSILDHASDDVLGNSFKKRIISKLEEEPGSFDFYHQYLTDREILRKDDDIITAIVESERSFEGAFELVDYVEEFLKPLKDIPKILVHDVFVDNLIGLLDTADFPQNVIPFYLEIPELKNNPKIWNAILDRLTKWPDFWWTAQYFELERLFYPRKDELMGVEESREYLKVQINKKGWPLMRATILQELTEAVAHVDWGESQSEVIINSRRRFFEIFKIPKDVNFTGELSNILLNVNYDGDFDELFAKLYERIVECEDEKCDNNDVKAPEYEDDISIRSLVELEAYLQQCIAKASGLYLDQIEMNKTANMVANGEIPECSDRPQNSIVSTDQPINAVSINYMLASARGAQHGKDFGHWSDDGGTTFNSWFVITPATLTALYVYTRFGKALIAGRKVGAALRGSIGPNLKASMIDAAWFAELGRIERTFEAHEQKLLETIRAQVDTAALAEKFTSDFQRGMDTQNPLEDSRGVTFLSSDDLVEEAADRSRGKTLSSPDANEPDGFNDDDPELQEIMARDSGMLVGNKRVHRKKTSEIEDDNK
jgi:hypothetical protein